MLLSGCAGDASDGATTRVTIDTINGVTFVRSSGEPPAWAVEEFVTLGITAGEDRADPQEFGRISGVIRDADGAIYVADASVPEIRVFDESGTFLRRIGRSGSGPGEFRTLQSIGWLGDTLVTLDGASARIGLLTREGRWLGQIHSSRLTGSGLYLHQTSQHELYAIEGRGGRVYVRYDATGARDTIAAPNDPSRGPSGMFEPDGRLAGRVTTPKRDDRVPLYVRGNRIYLATRDSLGVPYVKFPSRRAVRRRAP